MASNRTTNYKKLDNTSATIIDTDKGKILSIVEEQPIYSFRYTLPGTFHFTRENGMVDFFDGEEIKDDITEKERKTLIKTSIYQQGLLVEETEDLPADEVYNRNVLNEKQISKLLKEHNSKDAEYWRKHIDELDSIHALERLKRIMGENSFPNSITTYCDARIAELDEEELKDMEEPVDAPPKGI